MREIRFRAWDRKRGKFHWGNSNVCLTLCGRLMWQFGFNSPDLLSLEEMEDYTLMQYTGLKDKNGKEIYEGDIVRINYVRGYALYEVLWQDFRWILDCKKSEGVSAWFEYDGVPYSECVVRTEHDEPIEIIGNIYENPELLEAKL